MKKLLSVLLIVVVVCSASVLCSVPASAATKPSARYAHTGPSGIYMGSPWKLSKGAYVISTSSSPEISKNIINKLNGYCNIPVVSSILPCKFIEAGSWLVSYAPNYKYKVKICDASNNKKLWEGQIASGGTINLGTDAKSFKVYLAPLTNTSHYVALIKK